MSYSEPPEWYGRGARDRSGWPNRTFEPEPEGPRSHRERDTGEIRPSRNAFDHEMPTDPAVRSPLLEPGTARRVIRPHFTLAREDDPLWRLSLRLGVILKVLGIIALVGVIWLLALAVRYGGMPLWVAR
jgi:hypothetical protein